MKHLAKDIYLKNDGDYSFELMRKSFVKEGKTKGNESWTTLGYYSNMGRVMTKLKDLGYTEWVNGDVAACKDFIDTACKSLKEIV
jgi:hypothetical protein